MPASEPTPQPPALPGGNAPAESPARREPTSDEYMSAVYVSGPTLHNGPIVLAEYDPQWPHLAEREQQRIRAALGERIVQLEHVGSTAVPGLAAKPLIDLLLVVTDPADEPGYVPALEAAGYVLHIREPEWYEHRLFKGPDTNLNLHVFGPGAPEAERMLCFRDWLRTHPADRQRYENTKRTLARQDWKYVQHYADAKSAVVEQILARAQQSEA